MAKIKLRRDTYQNWFDANPVLALGEPAYDTTNNKLKIGDGTTHWQSLSYLTDETGTRTTDSNPVELATPTIVWSSLDRWIASAKLTIQVETNETGDATGWHTQSCEAIIAARANTGDPHMTVYGVTHTSVDPLVTFTVGRNVSTGLIEIMATPTAAMASTAYLKIHSVEMMSRD